MKKVIMYKYYNPDRLFGGWGWSIEEAWDDWNNIYSEPYEVEIPDDFRLANNIYHKVMYFKGSCNIGYQLSKSGNDENCMPYLIGGSPVECIRLKVIGPYKEK